jgi:hypothetical protein
MPAAPVHVFRLSAHPATPSQAIRAIGGRLSRIPDGLLVSYVVEGELARVRIPQPGAPRFTEELWRHTCCELFVARSGQPAYHEFNFSPSGAWAVYGFRKTRERLPLDAGLDANDLDPHVTVRRAAEKLELDAVILLDRLSPGCAGTKLALGLSAVVEHEDGSLSYWALKHPVGKPDFHHPDAFALDLDEVRN